MRWDGRRGNAGAGTGGGIQRESDDDDNNGDDDNGLVRHLQG